MSDNDVMNYRVMIYVNLLDEGANVCRPVMADECGPNQYRIGSGNVPPSEKWEFQPGDVVECTNDHVYQKGVKLAVRKIEAPFFGWSWQYEQKRK